VAEQLLASGREQARNALRDEPLDLTVPLYERLRGGVAKGLVRRSSPQYE